MSGKRTRSPDASLTTHDDDNIFRSNVIEDRASKFIGLYSPVMSAKTLQALPEIKSADHKIAGWRTPGNQRLLTPGTAKHNLGHDDDGEKYAGKKIERVLETTDAVGACVVARWWGGNMLGPARFTHIETCARDAIFAYKNHLDNARAKKQRLIDEADEHAKLSVALVERDQNIVVLRALAASKEESVKNAILKGTEALERAVSKGAENDRVGANHDHDNSSGKSDDRSNATANTSEEQADVGPMSKTDQPNSTPDESNAKVETPKPAMDYSSLPIERLRALDRARDATLSFLLKRIDRADAKIAALEMEADLTPD